MRYVKRWAALVGATGLMGVSTAPAVGVYAASGSHPQGAPAPRATAPAPLFLVVGENTSASQITTAHAPYLTRTLKPRAAWLTSYHSFTRSKSLGNYIAMTSGQFTRCEARNDLPATCHQSVDNVFEQLQRASRPWFVFTESATSACDLIDHGAAWSRNIYPAHHNPAVYYTGIYGPSYAEEATPKPACRDHDLPMGTTAPNDTSVMDAALRSGAVGDLNVIIPNNFENGHDVCGTRDRIRQFDDFLAREVPKIEASPAFAGGGTLVITWDEGGDKPLNPGNPLLLALGAGVKTGVVGSGAYNHYSLLRSIQDRLQLKPLAHARSARPLPIFQ
jgi:hypothetical protein